MNRIHSSQRTTDTKRRVLYFMPDLEHARVFESFLPHPQLREKVLCPYPHPTNGLVSEGLDDFGLERMYYSDLAEAGRLARQFEPHVLVVSDLNRPLQQQLMIKSGKRVFVHHGLIASYVKSMPFGTDLPKLRQQWGGYDLYCGAGQAFSEWIRFISPGTVDNRILLNACPQLDLVRPAYVNQHRDLILAQTKNPTAQKSILFFGFELKDYSQESTPHLQDFYWTLIELERLARANNWLVFLKSKGGKERMLNFLSAHTNLTWTSGYANDFTATMASKHVHLIDTTTHAYRYLFADVIVINGCSTTEIEAAMIHKPLVIVNCEQDKYFDDPYSSLKSGVAIGVDHRNPADLEAALSKAQSTLNPTAQDSFICTTHGILNDGLHYRRIQERILTL